MTGQQPPLDPAVASAIVTFDAEHGARCRNPDAIREWCFEVSSAFAETLAAAGVPARVVEGLRMGTLPQFPDVELVLGGHAAVLAPERYDEKAGEWVGEVVYDWTARQFDPQAPVPLTQPLVEWRATWRAVAKGEEAL